jgi:hypothetical protein
MLNAARAKNFGLVEGLPNFAGSSARREAAGCRLGAGAYFEPDPATEAAVPYDVNADLPPSVRSHLPEHAQDIFREAFNHAYAAHAHDVARRKPRSASPGRR